MSRAVIRLGDYTSHGGRVISASARFTIDGIPVALWGDHCSCPIPGHDNCVICEGEVNAMFDGRPVALEGHKTTCGCTLIASQHDRCSVSPLVRSVAIGSSREASFLIDEEDSTDFDQHFHLTDDKTGESLAKMQYRLQTESGQTIEGFTDENGLTQIIKGKRAEKITISIFDII